MRKTLRRALLLLLASLLLLSAGAGMASAKITEYPSVRVYADGLLAGRGYRAGQEIYLSLGDLCRYLGLEAEETLTRGTYDVSVTAEGFELRARIGQPYLEVNHRYLYNPRGILASEGRFFFPVSLVETLFHVLADVSPELDRVDLDLRQFEPLRGGERWYEDRFGEENLFWLERLISAEASDQPIEGMIGVGNVVLNRVASEKFPDTIYGVIFDTKNGVQFAPVYDGGIDKEANGTAKIAARIALEGYRTVGDSLFFIAPASADDSWLKNYYVYVTHIGRHDFYM